MIRKYCFAMATAPAKRYFHKNYSLSSITARARIGSETAAQRRAPRNTAKNMPGPMLRKLPASKPTPRAAMPIEAIHEFARTRARNAGPRAEPAPDRPAMSSLATDNLRTVGRLLCYLPASFRGRAEYPTLSMRVQCVEVSFVHSANTEQNAHPGNDYSDVESRYIFWNGRV